MTHVLSEYEERRLLNIKRNEDFLKSIGMNIVTDEVKKLNSNSSSSQRKSHQRNRIDRESDEEYVLPLPTRTTRSSNRERSSNVECSADTIPGENEIDTPLENHEESLNEKILKEKRIRECKNEIVKVEVEQRHSKRNKT